MTRIADVFPKIQTAKTMVWQMPGYPHFRTHFDSQHVTDSQTIVKSAWQHFYHIFSSLLGIFSRKIYLLVICEILGVFLNTLTADHKYFLHKSQNLLQPIEMEVYR